MNACGPDFGADAVTATWNHDSGAMTPGVQRRTSSRRLFQLDEAITMFRLLSRVLITFLTLAGLSLGAAAAGTKPFVAGSLEQIEKSYHGRPFLLIVWSLDCPSCLRELTVLAEQVKRHPEMPLVMVSTDDPSRTPDIAATLAKHGLGRLDSWVFAEGNSQRLRYEIDKTWYGEMPRSYFYDAGHRRVPLSGAVTEQHINVWLAADAS